MSQSLYRAIRESSFNRVGIPPIYLEETIMLKQLRPAIVMLGLFTLLTGIVYPLIVTAAAQMLFPFQANGSVVFENGQPVASELIGQQFTNPRYFWGRLSATGSVPYTAFNGETLTGSSGSNLGPLNPALLDAVRGRIGALKDADPSQTAPVPVDLVTASGSGLDPHISPAAAEYQAARVASSRGVLIESIRELIRKHTEARQLGVLGEPRVHVLRLNRALDQMAEARK